jgi:vacuolar-type H+-ATPase subunit E/Vma4
MMDSGETIQQMIKLIQQEAREKAQIIEEDGKQRLVIEKEKIYNEERDKLFKMYKKKAEDQVVQSKTTKSRMINQNRLQIQNNRNGLVLKLKEEIVESLKLKFKDKVVYKALLKGIVYF